MTLIIGLAGRAQHGKSSAADAIQAHCIGKSVTAAQYDIGDLVRRYCIANRFLPDKPRAELNEAEKGILQRVGKDRRDVHGPDFWIGQIFRNIQDDKLDVALIPNLRYENEAHWCWDFGGKVVRITALNANGSEFISPDREPNHPSETELHNVTADHYITAYLGEQELVQRWAIALFDYLWGMQCRRDSMGAPVPVCPDTGASLQATASTLTANNPRPLVMAQT